MRRKLTISIAAAAAIFMMANNPVLANWEQTNGTWNYKESGQNVTNTWKQVDGKWYYFNRAGEMQSGWLEKDGKWYYLDSNNGDMKEGWVKDGEKWYYLDNATGEMQSGWLEKEGKWYYLDPNDGDMKEGWVQDDKKWYYLDDKTGEMATGWKKTGNNWYFLDNSGSMQTGVVEVNGKIYALDEANGNMKTGTVLLSNNLTYTFDPITGEAVGDTIPVPTKAYSSDGRKQEDLSATVKQQIQKMQERQWEEERNSYSSSDDDDDDDDDSSSSSSTVRNVKIQEITVPKSGMVDVVLSQAVSLDISNFYISCPAGKDMTILKVETEKGIKKNKVYHITTTHFNDNTYNMEITLSNGKKIEKTFETSLAAPEITDIETKRIDKNTAKVSFISDSAGALYYMVVPTNTSKQTLSTQTASLQVLLGAEQVPQTGQDVQKNGTFMKLDKRGMYDLTIKDLKEDQAYTIYFATAQTEEDNAVLRGSELIAAKPEGGSSGENVGKIEIEEADAVSDSKIKFVLNKPTDKKLTLEDIQVECVNGEVHIGGIETEDNKTYYIPMQPYWFMNSHTGYTVYVTLPDGSKLEKKFYTDFDYPNLNEIVVKRIAEDEIEVTFRSDEGGLFYYGTTENPEESELPTADEIVENGLKANLAGGHNRLNVTIGKEDKWFYLVPIDEKGNRPPRFPERAEIPVEIEEPGSDSNDVVEMESITYSTNSIGYHKLTITLKDAIDILGVEKESIKIYPLDGQNLETVPRIVERGETYDGPNVFYLQYNIKFLSGRYELEFPYEGVTYRKEFEIK